MISDTKSQLARRFRKELEEKGYTVRVVDFVDPESSDGYNPLKYIRRYDNDEYSEQDVLTIANILSPVETARDPFWDQAAAIYLSSQKDGDILFTDWIENHKEGLAARKYYEIQSWREADKMWCSIEGVLSSKLAPFD